LINIDVTCETMTAVLQRCRCSQSGGQHNRRIAAASRVSWYFRRPEFSLWSFDSWHPAV